MTSDGGRGRSILHPVSYFLMSLSSEGQSLSANQISWTYLNSRLRHNYFRFWKKTNVRRIVILLPVSISTIFFVICMLFCIRLPNFVQIGAPTAEIWRHIHFSRWRPRPLNTTSGFVFVDVTAFRRTKSISKPNFVDISTDMSRLRYNYFRFWKTNVRHIGILLLVSVATISP